MYDKALRFISAVAVPVLVFSCAAFVSAVIVRYCVVPQRAILSSQAAQTASYRRLVSEKDKYRAIIAIMLGKKDSLTQKIERFSVPQRGAADLPSLLQLLISKAKEADIRFVKMEPQI